MRTNLNAYAVKDIQSNLFTAPYFLVNNTIAQRSFKAACLDPESKFYTYPQDYSLYHIGTYNIETGLLTPTTPEQIANATEYGSEKVTE